VTGHAEGGREPTRGTRLLRTPAGAAPVYTYEETPGIPPVSTLRFRGDDDLSHLPVSDDHAHSHDFLVLFYCERSGGTVRLGDAITTLRAGDLHLIPPGVVVGVGATAADLHACVAWTVFFSPTVLGASTGALLSWRAHPLLFPFVCGVAGGAQQLHVPPAARAAVSARLAALDAELRDRRDGHADAVVAHLTLLLVDVARLATDVAGGLRLRDEPLLAQVFGCIEERYADGLSLADVAAEVHLTPGHLTTVVRRRTGRTVGEWITERRMTEARTLLVQTDLSVAQVGTRVGYRDPAWFVRRFRQAHGTTPLRWRRAAVGAG
jgi:AraC family transcriptional activator of pobA